MSRINGKKKHAHTQSNYRNSSSSITPQLYNFFPNNSIIIHNIHHLDLICNVVGMVRANRLLKTPDTTWSDHKNVKIKIK